MDFTINEFNILLHLGLYLAVLILMKFLYVDPVLSLLRKRDDLTEGRRQSGEEKLKRLDVMRQEYETKLNALKQELEQKRASGLQKIQKESNEKIEKLKRELESKLAGQHSKIQDNLADLQKRTAALGEELGREVADGIMTARVVKL